MVEEADNYITWENRISLLEGSIAKLQHRLDELEEVDFDARLKAFKESLLFNELQDFGDSLTKLQSELLDLRRFASRTSLTAQANSLRHTLMEVHTTTGLAQQRESAEECLKYLDRVFASTRTEIRFAAEPEAIANGFRSKLEPYIREKGFEPWLPGFS